MQLPANRVAPFYTLISALLVVLSGPVSGQVLISEIMYNPDSNEGGIGKDAPPN